MRFLSFKASTERHIDWAEDILSSMVAHQRVNYRLTEEQLRVLAEEEKQLRPWVTKLKADEEIRKSDLGESLRGFRAERRVADYLCDLAVVEADSRLRPYRAEVGRFLPGGFTQIFQGMTLSRLLSAGAERTASIVQHSADLLSNLRTTQLTFIPEIAAQLERAGKQLAEVNVRIEEVVSRRVSHSARMHRGEVELREALQQMNGRLRSHFTQDFIESLYPPLRKGNARGAEDVSDEDEHSADDVEAA